MFRLLVTSCLIFICLIHSADGQNYHPDIEVMSNATISNLSHINSPDLDFSPVIWKDLLVFVTNEREELKVDNQINEKYFDLKYADENVNQDFERDAYFPPVINSEWHEGPATFNADGGVMYFTRDLINFGRPVENIKNIVPLQIYKSVLNIDGWSEPQRLAFCHEDFSYAHPTVNAGGDTLIFASNMEGGMGKMDLYQSVKLSGQWTKPRAISSINTSGNDWFPQLYGNLLFFASDGKHKDGNLDVYVYNRSTDSLMTLPAPINSSYDDFGFFVKDNHRAFYTSNRPGGYGKDDIYVLDSEVSLFNSSGTEPELQADALFTLIDSKTNKRLSEGDCSIRVVYDKNEIIKSLLDSQSRMTGESGDASTMILNADSEGDIRIEGKYPKLVYLSVDRPGYQYFEEAYYLESPDTTLIRLEPEVRVVTTTPTSRPIVEPTRKTTILNNREVSAGSVLVFENIYYDYNSDVINTSSARELDQLATAMLSNPNLKVQLSSHTDSRGESLYNQLLSDRRAESAKKYLISKGVVSSNIVAIGFGESRLRNQCDNNVPCTDEEHKFNRRTEVRILAN